MLITIDQIESVAARPVDRANADSVIIALHDYGDAAGLLVPHRQVHFLAQVGWESGMFRYDREVWGPTAAQVGYDTRTDLGNTAAQDGDGKKNAGRGPIQLTGGYNIGRFYEWCVKQGMNPPDFRADPDLINGDPWEGLSAIWYWSEGNPTGKSLNVYADENNAEQITKKINGGLNGYDGRLALYVRFGLVVLGYDPGDIVGFQRWAQASGYLPANTPEKKQDDGDAGPLTRSAIHNALSALTPKVDTKSSPVTQDVVVVAKGSDKRGWTVPVGAGAVLSWLGAQIADIPLGWKLAAGGLVVLAVVYFLWRGEKIIRRIKALREEIEKP